MAEPVLAVYVSRDAYDEIRAALGREGILFTSPDALLHVAWIGILPNTPTPESDALTVAEAA